MSAHAAQALPYAVARVLRLEGMGTHRGKVRSHTVRGRVEFFLDLRALGGGRAYTYRTPWGRREPWLTRESAEDALRDIHHRVTEGVAIQHAVSEALNLRDTDTLELAAEWLAYLGERQERGLVQQRTVEKYKGDIANWWGVWKGMPVQRITPNDVERWALEMRAKLDPNTIRTKLRIWHAFLSWVESRGLIARIPRNPEIKVVRELRPTLRFEQQDAVIEAIAPERRGIFLAMAELALRPSEARVLLAKDIGPTFVRIHRAAKDYNRQPVIGTTKTSVERVLPVDLCPRLLAWCDAYMPREAKLSGALAFPGPGGADCCWSQADLTTEWRAACEAAGVPYIPIRDSTRKSTLRELRRAGAEYEMLRELAGHATVATTEIYAEPGTGLADLRRLRRD